MARCALCGKELSCGHCKVDQPVGQTVLSCPLKEGALWVHVMDTDGNSVKGVFARKDQDTHQETGKGGLIKFDKLKSGPCTVLLEPLAGEPAKTYDLPATASKAVEVFDGAVSQVLFELRLKPLLAVKLIPKDGKKFDGATALLDGKIKQDVKDNVAVFGPVEVGNHQLTIELQKSDLETYRLDDPVVPELLHGADETVKVPVERRTKLKIKVVSDDKHLFQNAIVKLDAKTEVKTVDSVADFGDVTPGGHELTVELSKADDEDYETVLDFPEEKQHIDVKEGEPNSFDVKAEILYKEFLFVAHCLLTVSKFSWTQQDGWKASYNGLPTDKADITARVAFLETVLQKARENVDDDPTQLKILVFPECFFLGKYGAYQITELSSVAAELQKKVKGAEWKHWIFVFGTVNGVYLPDEDDKASGFSFFNISPVIRGGSDADIKSYQEQGASGAKADAYIRIIQKTFFSAELNDQSELLQDGNAQEVLEEDRRIFDKVTKQEIGIKPVQTRSQLVSEKVKKDFDATQFEVVLGNMIVKLLAKAEPQVSGKTIGQLFADSGLSEAYWTGLKSLVNTAVANDGLLTVVRKLRALKLPATVKSLGDCEFCGVAGEGLSQETFLLKWQDVVTMLLPRRKFPPIQPLDSLETAKKTCATKLLDFQRPGLISKIDMLIEKINKSEMDDWEDIKDKSLTRTPEKFDWTAAFKQLLKLYVADDTSPAKDDKSKSLNPKESEAFALENFCFACRRKPGPWLTEKQQFDSDKIPSYKRVTIGVEICADHSRGRLKGATPTGARKRPPIQVQLIPSAGMSFNLKSIAAMDAGYLFNCDGWNASGGLLTEMKKRGVLPPGEALSSIKEVTLPNCKLEPGRNPLFPHSELVINSAGTLTSQIPDKVVPLAYGAVGDIFAADPGALHIYKKQKIPKV